MTASGRKGWAAYAAWLVAHALAGLLFAAGVAVIPLTAFWVLVLHGLLAGAVFGMAQWLVLRRFLPGVRWWLPVTVIASPLSWFWAYWWAAGTFASGGWIGAAISAVAQMVVLVVAFRNDTRRSAISVSWLAAAMIGSAIFYFAYLYQLLVPAPNSLPLLASLTAGSVGFAAVTGIVVAVLASSLPIRTTAAPS